MSSAPHYVDVIKLNILGEETWRYQGKILKTSENSLLLEAFFNREDLPFHGITLRENDRFIERYYLNRWYNIFEIHDRTDDRIKGWYCNITKPAKFTPDSVAYVDLALDVLVYPDGSYLILDQDEFEELPIGNVCQENALKALDELLHIVENGNLASQMI